MRHVRTVPGYPGTRDSMSWYTNSNIITIAMNDEGNDRSSTSTSSSNTSLLPGAITLNANSNNTIPTFRIL